MSRLVARASRASKFALALVATLGVLGLVASASAAQDAPPRSARSQPSAGAPLNINSATVADLQKLPGIGAATAARILEHRQKNGPFKKIEELMNVRGIGEKSFLKLKPLVTVTPPKADGDK